jgi:NAD(P)-dependent dehydrogenase (short-subunit alcohol dehydrogenase family)
VNNAGVAPTNLAEDVTEADFDRTLQVNLKGTFFASQAAYRHMKAQGYGRIVMMGSQAGTAALPTESVYCMTKAGIAHLTACLAVEWGTSGVNVNCVAPTFTRTSGTEKALSGPPSRPTSSSASPPCIASGSRSRWPGPWCSSPAASLVTGHTLLVDGGWTAR